MAEDVAGYIAEKGWKPAGLLHSSVKWFETHPEALAAAREGKKLGLSLTQIRLMLHDLHGFPYTSNNPLMLQGVLDE